MPDLGSLNEAQRKAVTHGEGPLLVLAGPGSGKTYTITQRIFYLLREKKVPPEQILVITFTKEAARSMQNRFMEQSDRLYPVNFGTFHSIFYHILKESHILTHQKLLSIHQKKAILLPRLKKVSSSEDLSAEAVKMLAAFSFFKNTNDEAAAKQRLTPDLQNVFWQIYREYEQERKRMGAVDFDDMLYECLTFLEQNRQMRKFWQNRFSHILIDEFQDINPVQYEIVRLLTKPPFSVFAVGDDDQAIYGFRGSRPACLRQFAEEYHARQILLNVNYRSRKEIIHASLLVIGENKDRFEKHLKAAGENLAQGKVCVSAFGSREQQYKELIEKLEKERHTDVCAVLFRTNLFMQGFAVRLKKAQIPYDMKEKAENIYEHFIVKDILAYLRLAAGEKSRELILRILNKPSRYISREALEEETADLGEIRAYYLKNGSGKSYGNQLEEIERLEKQLEYLRKAALKPAVRYLCKAVGYERYLRRLAGNDAQKLEEWLELLEWLCTDASQYKNLQEWREAQQNYAESLEAGGMDTGLATSFSGGNDKPHGAVRLMTVHAAKGLEFDRVYMPDCNENVFPHGQMPDQNAVEEERRIFYVAMTRAKKSLELLCITGTRERPRQPSRFLNPLWKEYYSSTNSSNSQLSRYSSKASATRSYSSSSSIKDNSGSSLGSSGFSL